MEQAKPWLSWGLVYWGGGGGGSGGQKIRLKNTEVVGSYLYQILADWISG